MFLKAALIVCAQSACMLLIINKPMHATEPVRMGCGVMTFDTVPEWGLDSQGKSQIGPTHGSVVVDSRGQIYISSNLGIFVFSPDGMIVRRYLGSDYTGLHDMEMRNEDGHDYIYGARNKAGEGIKIEAATGAIKLRLGIPSKEECGLEIPRWSPTAITVGPNGDIYLSDGYASNRIFRFGKDGQYRSNFGNKGNGTKEFNTAHGMTLDDRYSPPRLLICDRNHQPKGRLVQSGVQQSKRLLKFGQLAIRLLMTQEQSLPLIFHLMVKYGQPSIHVLQTTEDSVEIFLISLSTWLSHKQFGYEHD